MSPTRNGIDTWAGPLGLLPVPVFGAAVRENQYVLLNGTTGNFCLDLDGKQADNRSVAWSANVGHYVSVVKDEVDVQRWDASAAVAERYRLDSVLRSLPEFHTHLDKTEPRPEMSAVSHAVRVFREMRGMLPDSSARDTVLTFLVLLGCATDESDRTSLRLDDWALPSIATAASSTIRPEDWQLLLDELVRGRYLDGLVLDPRLLLRHAAGQVFQEAHYEANLISQLRFPGFPSQVLPAHTKTIGVGIHFTPPALARTLVEQALRLVDTGKPTLKIFDPACGSGEFLREALRQLRLIGYIGKIELIGFDVSELASDLARFVLSWEARNDLNEVIVRILDTDSLSSSTKWPDSVDVLLMNPPFVSYEDLTPDQLAKMRAVMGHLAKGRVDMSSAFVWRAVESLPESAVIATLIPASFLDGAANRPLRSEMSQRVVGTFVARLGSQVLFTNALVDAGAFVGKIGHSRAEYKTVAFWADHRDQSTAIGLRELRKITRAKQAAALPIDREGFSIYTIPNLTNDSKAWSPRSYRAWNLLRQLSHLPTVKDLFSVHTGARPGHLAAFVVDKALFCDLPKAEQRYFRPAVVNQSVTFGQLQDSKYVFYPYGRRRLTDEQELKRKLKEFYRNVLLGHKSALMGRLSRRKAQWWEMSEPRAWQFGIEPKLVSVYFGAAGSFAYDGSGQFVVVQGFAWLPKQPLNVNHVFHPKLALAYLALLNSPIMNHLLSATSASVQGGQWDLSARYVENVAIPNLASAIGTTLVNELATLGQSMQNGASGASLDERLKDLAGMAYGLASARDETSIK